MAELKWDQHRRALWCPVYQASGSSAYGYTLGWNAGFKVGWDCGFSSPYSMETKREEFWQKFGYNLLQEIVKYDL